MSTPPNNSDYKGNAQKEAVVFKLFEREYHIYGEQIINDVEASSIYEKLLLEAKVQTTSKNTS